MPKKKLEVAKEDEKQDLKTLAKQFSKYANSQYRENVSYTPDSDTIAAVTVSGWVEMPEAFAAGAEIPGLPFGVITCVYGKPDTGKTTFIQDGIAACQKQDILPILVLTEHKFAFDRLERFMNADPEAMLVFHADNLEQGYGFVEKILRDVKRGELVFEDDNGNDQVVDVSKKRIYIFWDSIGNTMSETELQYETEDWDKSMGKAAKAIKTLTKRVNRLLSRVRERVGVCFINQSYQSMPSYGPSVETPYGGEGVPYSSALVLRLRRVKDLKMTSKGKDIVIGLETKIEIKKNHITHKRPIFSVYTTAIGMVPPTKEALDAYKKIIR